MNYLLFKLNLFFLYLTSIVVADCLPLPDDIRKHPSYRIDESRNTLIQLRSSRNRYNEFDSFAITTLNKTFTYNICLDPDPNNFLRYSFFQKEIESENDYHYEAFITTPENPFQVETSYEQYFSSEDLLIWFPNVFYSITQNVMIAHINTILVDYKNKNFTGLAQEPFIYFSFAQPNSFSFKYLLSSADSDPLTLSICNQTKGFDSNNQYYFSLFSTEENRYIIDHCE